MGTMLGEWAELALQAVGAAREAVARLGEAAGRRVVAAHAEATQTKAAPLFRKLAANFELCVYGLSHVRRDLDQLRHPAFRSLSSMLLA